MNDDRRKVLKGTGGMAVMGLAASAGLFVPGPIWRACRVNCWRG